MKDALIGFEVAKLAKEKGFNIECIHFYTKSRSKMFGIDEHGRAYPIKNTPEKLYTCGEYAALNKENVYFAATQSLMQRWLREEHGLIISIEPTFTYALTTNVGYYAYVKKVNKEINTLEYLYLDIYFSATYEESLEIGLLEALKLI